MKSITDDGTTQGIIHGISGLSDIELGMVPQEPYQPAFDNLCFLFLWPIFDKEGDPGPLGRQVASSMRGAIDRFQEL